MAEQESKVPRWIATSAFRSPSDSPPPPVKVEALFGAHSQRGALRSANDDHYLMVRLGRTQETIRTSLPDGDVPTRFDEYGYGMVLADGMGGAGETASRLAIATLANLAIYFGRWNVRIDEPIADEVMDRAERFYRNVDAMLLRASRDSQRVLQTTLTCVYTAGIDLFFAHVGHSRVYLFRDDRLMQLTRDHTLERDRPGKAILRDVASSARDSHHIVTETLGGGDAGGSRIDIERSALLDGDRLLLCTNGLTDVVEDARISGVFRSRGTPDDQCRALVDLAASSGGKDDVTALVAHYRVG